LVLKEEDGVVKGFSVVCGTCKGTGKIKGKKGKGEIDCPTCEGKGVIPEEETE